jgi:MYXO-CTERM domain-containing protein
MKIAALMIVLAGVATSASAAVSFTGATYSQNFDSLLNTGTANPWAQDSTILGWVARRAAGGPDWATYRADTGSSNSGAIYSYGAASSTERAFGSVSSGTPGTINFALVLQNNTADVLTAFDLSFFGEQWRMGGSSAATTPGLAQTLVFDFKTIAAFALSEVDAAATGYTALPALNFVSPQFGPTTAVALDGNLPANRASLSAASVPVTWNPGEFLVLRWTDINDVNNDHGLAIDDLSFNATPAPGALALLGIAGVVAGRRKR